MTQSGGYGQLGPMNSSSEYNSLMFIISQALAQVRTCVVVQVTGVTNDGGLSPVGFVHATPLVNQLDGHGNATPHGVIYNLPYFRLQGGTNAVILDPKVGDKGIAIICDRDISSVKTNKARSNPGSLRKFDLSDGVYVGGILNGVPENFIRFLTNGNISIKSLAKVTIEAPLIELDGAITINGTVTGAGGTIDLGASNLTTTGTMTGSQVTAGSIPLTTHHHTGVTTGGGTSGPPVP